MSFTFTRSSKPGGQNVNKVNTRVTLLFDVKASPSLSDEQKNRILHRLETRINKLGILRVISFRYRTQGLNRAATIERFVELLVWALAREKPRKKTRVSKASKRKRLDDKKHKSRVKQTRAGKKNWSE